MQFADVAVLEHGATLWHTHSGEPMRAILTGLEREGRPLPDLVVADHGWAGYAGQHGVDSVGYADCNDPALFLAESEGDRAGGRAAGRPCGQPALLRPPDGVSARGGGPGLTP